CGAAAGRSDGEPGAIAGGPGPLEVEAAEMAADIQYLADEIQPRAVPGFHGFRADRLGGYPAEGDFRSAIAFGGRGLQGPALELGGDALQLLVAVIRQRFGRCIGPP